MFWRNFDVVANESSEVVMYAPKDDLLISQMDTMIDTMPVFDVDLKAAFDSPNISYDMEGKIQPNDWRLIFFCARIV